MNYRKKDRLKVKPIPLCLNLMLQYGLYIGLLAKIQPHTNVIQ